MTLRTQLLAIPVQAGPAAGEEPIFPGWRIDDDGEMSYPELDVVLKAVSNHLLDVATQYRDEAETLTQRTHRVIPLEIAGALETLSRAILDKDKTEALTQGELDREASLRDDHVIRVNVQPASVDIK